MRALVTGAAGFIGSHLCDRLVREGWEVRGLDSLDQGSTENLAASPEVDLSVADVRDPGAVAQAMKGAEVVFHLAALRAVERSLEAPADVLDVNVGGMLRVLEAARVTGARVIFASSSSVYGQQEQLPVAESALLHPLSPYGASKGAAELCGTAWARSYAVPVVALRLFSVYGPRQDPAGRYAQVVPRFVHACLHDASPMIRGDGTQSRDFTYVDDVVEAMVLATRAPVPASGEVFNIARGRAISVTDLLAEIISLTGSTVEPVHVPAVVGDPMATHADLSRARGVLGFEPRVDLAEGLRHTIEGIAREKAERGSSGSVIG